MRAGTITSENIYIKDGNNNVVTGTSLNMSQDLKTCTISPPNSGYAKNNFYTLFIDTGIKSLGENSISNQQTFDFYIP